MPTEQEIANSQQEQGTDANAESQQSASENQQQQQTAIDWTKIDPNSIPEDVVKKTKFTKSVLDESIARRKKIAELKGQLEALESDSPEDKPAAKPDKVETSTDMPAWAKAMMDKIEAIETASTVDARKALVAEAMKETRLPDGSEAFIHGNTKEEILASAKALAALTVPDKLKSGSGYGNTEDATARASRIIAERLNRGKDGQLAEGTFFSPAVHKSK